jgi:ankyrin repeat protein
LNRSAVPGLPAFEELQTARDAGPDTLAALIANRTPASLTDVGVAAVSGGIERFVVALLKVGFKPNVPNAEGRTALEAAASRGQDSSIHRLLAAADADGSESGH